MDVVSPQVFWQHVVDVLTPMEVGEDEDERAPSSSQLASREPHRATHRAPLSAAVPTAAPPAKIRAVDSVDFSDFSQFMAISDPPLRPPQPPNKQSNPTPPAKVSPIPPAMALKPNLGTTAKRSPAPVLRSPTPDAYAWSSAAPSPKTPTAPTEIVPLSQSLHNNGEFDWNARRQVPTFSEIVGTLIIAMWACHCSLILLI